MVSGFVGGCLLCRELCRKLFRPHHRWSPAFIVQVHARDKASDKVSDDQAHSSIEKPAINPDGPVFILGSTRCKRPAPGLCSADFLMPFFEERDRASHGHAADTGISFYCLRVAEKRANLFLVNERLAPNREEQCKDQRKPHIGQRWGTWETKLRTSSRTFANTFDTWAVRSRERGLTALFKVAVWAREALTRHPSICYT